MADARTERIGRNEALFRQVNEQVEELNETFGAAANVSTVVCECGDQSCIDQITLAKPEYERLRSDPILFLVVPGHDIPDVEHVIERTDRYWVVRKDAGEPARIARELDERG